MAGRLRGMTAEPIASAGGGLPPATTALLSLGSVLRDHKVAVAAAGPPPSTLLGSRTSMLLGLAALSPSLAISSSPTTLSIASSPAEACVLIQPLADVDEFEEDDIWGIIPSWHGDTEFEDDDDDAGQVCISGENTGDAASLQLNVSVKLEDEGEGEGTDLSRSFLLDPGFPIHGRTAKGYSNGSMTHVGGHALAIKETSLQKAFQGFSSLGPKSGKPVLVPTALLADPGSSMQEGVPGPRHAPTASRTIAHPLQAAESCGSHAGHQSAPVNIPDWSKILKLRPHLADSGLVSTNKTEDTEEEGLPPHELLAREHARSTFSVCKGYGRTLKGRDLSRVRNAVWRKTGFVD